ncbi:MAG: hypothetical protein K6L76_13045 [Agarilytica sp.]
MRIMLIALSIALAACSGVNTKQYSDDRQALTSLAERAQKYWKDNNIESENKSLLVASRGRHFTRSSWNCEKQEQAVSSKSVGDLTLSFFEADIREAVVELSVMSGLPIVIDDTVEGFVTANLENVSLSEALTILLAPGGYSYRFNAGYVLVGGSSPNSPSFTNLAITCSYKPKYMSAVDLASSLTAFYQQFIRIPQNGNSLTITAPHKILKEIETNICVFDQAPDQVLLEMSIVEVSREALDILGVSWDRFGRDANTNKLRRMGAGEWSGVGPIQANTATDAFTIGLLPQRTLADSISFLRSEGEANLKAMPSIISLDGKEASFSTTHSIWLPYVGSGNNRSTELTYGVDMKVTPKISHDGEILLSISKASVSDLSHTEKGDPYIVSHQVSNAVRVRDGDYLVLGGLLQTKKINGNSGVPRLKDIKVIGKGFGREETIVRRMEVLIMIKPTILERPENV